MELLGDEGDAEEQLPNEEADSMLPPLPVKTPTKTHVVNPKDLRIPADEVSTTEGEPANDQVEASPQLRTQRCSYRNKSSGSLPRDVPEQRVKRSGSLSRDGSVPSQKSEKFGRSGDVGSMFSRPTTAGADSASTTHSLSWRQEWTPGIEPSSEKPGGMVFRPLPVGSRKAPPLPPLPMKPPESGSVLGTAGPEPNKQPFGAAMETGSKEPPSLLKASTSAPSTSDDAAMRRSSLSANATVATPPPVAKRRTCESPIGTTMVEAPASACISTSNTDAGPSPSIDAVGCDAAETDAKGANTTAASGVEEGCRREGNFSELARAFTCMEGAIF